MMTKEEYIARYKETVTKYLTYRYGAEGKMCLHEQLHEQEFVLKNVFKLTDQETQDIYHIIYWKLRKEGKI